MTTLANKISPEHDVTRYSKTRYKPSYQDTARQLRGGKNAEKISETPLLPL